MQIQSAIIDHLEQANHVINRKQENTECMLKKDSEIHTNPKPPTKQSITKTKNKNKNKNKAKTKTGAMGIYNQERLECAA